MADRTVLEEARKIINRGRLSEWACAVLDVSRWKYDRKGWHDVARLGANKIIDLLRYTEMLEAEVERLRKEVNDD